MVASWDGLDFMDDLLIAVMVFLHSDEVSQ